MAICFNASSVGFGTLLKSTEVTPLSCSLITKTPHFSNSAAASFSSFTLPSPKSQLLKPSLAMLPIMTCPLGVKQTYIKTPITSRTTIQMIMETLLPHRQVFPAGDWACCDLSVLIEIFLLRRVTAIKKVRLINFRGETRARCLCHPSGPCHTILFLGSPFPVAGAAA